MTDFLHLVTKAANEGTSVIVICFDLTKTFHWLSYCKLLMKAKSYGLRSHLLAWFSSYLSSGMNVLNVNGTSSKPYPIIGGAIQGSLLVPPLVLLYINDILYVIRY